MTQGLFAPVLLVMFLARSAVATETPGTLCFLAEGRVADSTEGLCIASPDTTTEVALRIEGSDRTQWPVPVTAELTRMNSKERWRWVIPAGSVQSLKKLLIPRGSWQFKLEAPHHAAHVETIDAGAAKRTLNRIVLRRLPQITGRIVHAADGAPLPGTSIAATTGEPLANADFTGAFAIEIDGEWPKELVVSQPGYGRKWLAVAQREADLEFGDIALRIAGAMQLFVTGAEKVTASLEIESPDGERRAIASRKLTGDEHDRFADLAPGAYFLTLTGNTPLARHSTEVRIVEGEVAERHIELTPSDLTITVRDRRGPAAGATVLLKNHRGGWTSTVTTNDRGQVESPLWQGGEFTAFVTLPEVARPYTAHRTLAGSDISWNIDAVGPTLRGRVVAGPSRRPMPGAIVVSTATQTSGMTTSRLTTDSAGRFEMPFALAGNYELVASAEGHLDATTQFTLQASEVEREVELVLEEGVAALVSVVNKAGQPIAGALVVDAVTTNPLTTDANGSVRIRLRRNETRTVYILPRNGSFAVADVRAQEKPIVVTVPPGEMSIGVRAQSNSGEAVGNVALLARYNGRLIPPNVLQAMEAQRLRFSIGSSGSTVLDGLPAGSYDFWPYFPELQNRELNEAALGPAAARIVPQPGGVNWIVITFRRKG